VPSSPRVRLGAFFLGRFFLVNFFVNNERKLARKENGKVNDSPGRLNKGKDSAVEIYEMLERKLPAIETERDRKGLRPLARLTTYRLDNETLERLFLNENWLNGYDQPRVDWLVKQWADSLVAQYDALPKVGGGDFDPLLSKHMELAVRRAISGHWLLGDERAEEASRLRGCLGYKSSGWRLSRITEEIDFLDKWARVRFYGWVESSVDAMAAGVPLEHLMAE
jgi:hypothetical protein